MLKKAYLLLWLVLLPPLAQAAVSTIQFDSATYEVNEGDGYVTITVTRIGDGKASVKVVTNNGTAKKGKDYEKTVKKLKWNNGDDSDKTFTVNIFDDSKAEGNETFALKLKKAKGGELGSPKKAEVAIIDNDGPSSGTLQFSKTEYSVSEYDVSIDVFVNRVGGKDGAISVDCISHDESATAGDDYIAVRETLNWGDQDDDTQACTVAVIYDSVFENDETFNMELVNPTGGANIGDPGIAIVTIIDDSSCSTPSLLQFSSATYYVNESDGTIEIAVIRIDGSCGAASVKVITNDGTALQGKDYEKTAKRLEWDDGDSSDKTFTVKIFDDTEVEGNETFALRLKNVTGAWIGYPNEAEVTIVNSSGSVGRLKSRCVGRSLQSR
jgi:hypothetical protein